MMIIDKYNVFILNEYYELFFELNYELFSSVGSRFECFRIDLLEVGHINVTHQRCSLLLPTSEMYRKTENISAGLVEQHYELIQLARIQFMIHIHQEFYNRIVEISRI